MKLKLSRSVVPVFLIAAMAFTQAGCTPQQWQQFQQIATKVATYVSDAMLAVNIVKGFVEAALPAVDQATAREIFAIANACDEALQTEAQAIERSPTALDTPAQIAAAFPQFLVAWGHLTAAINARGILNPSPAPGAMLAARARTMPVPLLVADAHAR